MIAILTLLVISACLQTPSALQMHLSSNEPVCITITPLEKDGQVIDIKYSIAGINEKQTNFYVVQGYKQSRTELSRISFKSEGEV